MDNNRNFKTSEHLVIVISALHEGIKYYFKLDFIVFCIVNMSHQTLVYFERQEANLCGNHALNNLLQGPYFSLADLIDIAQSVRERERRLLPEHAESSARSTRAGIGNEQDDESLHIDESGNFSLEVMTQALENMGVELMPWRHPCMERYRRHPSRATGFLCHMHHHWFAIRRLGDGSFCNLNSLLARPALISEFYLDTLLTQLEAECYTIFVITVELPLPDRTQADMSSKHWFTLESIKAAAKQEQLMLSLKSLRSSDANTAALTEIEDPEFQQALRASAIEEGVHERMVIERSLQQSLLDLNGYQSMRCTADTYTTVSPYSNKPATDDEEDDLERAIAMSLDC